MGFYKVFTPFKKTFIFDSVQFWFIQWLTILVLSWFIHDPVPYESSCKPPCFVIFEICWSPLPTKKSSIRKRHCHVRTWMFCSSMSDDHLFQTLFIVIGLLFFPLLMFLSTCSVTVPSQAKGGGQSALSQHQARVPQALLWRAGPCSRPLL